MVEVDTSENIKNSSIEEQKDTLDIPKSGVKSDSEISDDDDDGG